MDGLICNKGLIIAYVMIDVGQDLLRQHLPNILKGEETHWGKLLKIDCW